MKISHDSLPAWLLKISQHNLPGHVSIRRGFICLVMKTSEESLSTWSEDMRRRSICLICLVMLSSEESLSASSCRHHKTVYLPGHADITRQSICLVMQTSQDSLSVWSCRHHKTVYLPGHVDITRQSICLVMQTSQDSPVVALLFNHLSILQQVYWLLDMPVCPPVSPHIRRQL